MPVLTATSFNGQCADYCADVMYLGHVLSILRVRPSSDLSSQTYKHFFSLPWTTFSLLSLQLMGFFCAEAVNVIKAVAAVMPAIRT